MLFRFCLYGFLKNQQYYDPFLILAFREKGLSFALIGLLIGFRELSTNLLEVPTGAVADVLGRRRAMIFSMLAYMVSFTVFGYFSRIEMLFVAMFLFSMGEAFRTGTHKAIIFGWLEHEGRRAEKTAVYGRTRSWSQYGSALSVLIAAALVFSTRRINNVFFCSLIPYGLNIVNFVTYPHYLDGPREEAPGIRAIIRTLTRAVKRSIKTARLRRLLTESMTFEGVYKTTKDYLQPVLKTAALSAPLLLGRTDLQRTAVLVGAVYFLLYLLCGAASRQACRLAEWARSEDRAAGRLWELYLILFLGLGIAVLMQIHAAMIAAFVALAVAMNFWRPIQVARIADAAGSRDSATVLSIDSQAKTVFAAIFAPLLGLAIDMARSQAEPLRFLPVAVLGLLVTVVMLLSAPKGKR